MANDYHMSYTPEYAPNYTVMSQPFQPRVNPTSNNQYKLRFNTGYIFDYNDLRTLKEPIEVKIAEGAGQEETVVIEGVETKNRYFLLDEGTKTTYYVLLHIKRSNGKIDKAEIRQGSIPDTVPNGFEKLSPTTDGSVFTNDNRIDQRQLIAQVPIKIAEFNGPFLERIYLRENLHLNLLKLAAFGYEGEEAQGNQTPVPIVIRQHNDMQVETDRGMENEVNLGIANSVLGIRGLIPDPNLENNVLTMEVSSDNPGLIMLGVDGNQFEPAAGDGGGSGSG